MNTPTTSHVLNPADMPRDRKDALIDALYAVHSKIFAGVTRSEFAQYVINSPADRTRIEVISAEGRIVGYAAVHTYLRVIDGERWALLRVESGKLPAYRRATNGNLIIREAARMCLRYPLARKAYLGCFVHPSAYLAMSHVAAEIYPHWSAPTPGPVQSVMRRLSDEFGLDPIMGAPQGVSKVGWITRDSAHDLDSWMRRTDAATRFFQTANPGYREGHGLVTYVPLSAMHLARASVALARRSWAKRQRARRKVALTVASSESFATN